MLGNCSQLSFPLLHGLIALTTETCDFIKGCPLMMKRLHPACPSVWSLGARGLALGLVKLWGHLSPDAAREAQGSHGLFASCTHLGPLYKTVH